MFAFSACSLEPAASSAAGPSGTALLKTNPVKPAPMQETILELTLRDPDGQPMTGAAVTLELTMPGMVMPPNRPPVAEAGNGVYIAKAIFAMSGEWEVRALVDHPAGGEAVVFSLRTR